MFVGCPWRVVRPKYETAAKQLSRKYPIAFRIVGREADQSVNELLQRIKDTLYSSNYAIFDLTGGNPNVTLEYGLADAFGVNRAIYLSSRRGGPRRTADSAIVSDLAGLTRQQYAQQAGLTRHLSRLCEAHPYTLQFERFMGRYRRKSPGEKRRLRTLALKIIHSLDHHQRLRRSAIVDTLLADGAGYAAADISEMILRLHQAELLISQQGPYAWVSIFIGRRRLVRTG